MDRFGGMTFIALIGIASVGLAGCGESEVAATDESAFADMQARGQEAMGVDQYTSTHEFDALPDGGRIELQRDVDDAAGAAQIREHLRTIARAFDEGEFDTPEFVHMQSIPGVAVMAERSDVISYAYRELPRGGEVRIVTEDPEAVRAVHEFLSFQRDEHRAGGRSHGPHGGMDHGGVDHDDMGHDGSD